MYFERYMAGQTGLAQQQYADEHNYIIEGVQGGAGGGQEEQPSYPNVAGLGMVFDPQKSLIDFNNPDSLTAQGDGCSISLDFTGTWDDERPNGQGFANLPGGEVFGVGFTATITVTGGLRGGIGMIGKQIVPNWRFWEINQKGAYTTFDSGSYNVLPQTKVRPHDIDQSNSPTKLSNNPSDKTNYLKYWDHPGAFTSGVGTFFGMYSFTITATNSLTKGSCTLSFGMLVFHTPEHGWQALWGRGQ